MSSHNTPCFLAKRCINNSFSSTQGFREDKDLLEAKQIMDNLEYHDFLGKEIAIQAELNFRMLRKKGVTVRKTINVIIATFCIRNNELYLPQIM